MNDIYLSTKDFLFQSVKSDSSTRNFLQVIKTKYDDFVIKSKNRFLYNKDLLLFFQYPPGTDIDKFIFRLRNRKSKTNISSNSYLGFWKRELTKKEWHLYGHISYLENYSIDDCIYFFYKLKKFLRRKFRANIEIFYTTERNKVKGGGHHNHFLLRTLDSDTIPYIKQCIDAFFRRKNFSYTEVKRYDKELDGISYILKEIDKVKDGFDLFSTRKDF